MYKAWAPGGGRGASVGDTGQARPLHSGSELHLQVIVAVLCVQKDDHRGSVNKYRGVGAREACWGHFRVPCGGTLRIVLDVAGEGSGW